MTYNLASRLQGVILRSCQLLALLVIVAAGIGGGRSSIASAQQNNCAYSLPSLSTTLGPDAATGVIAVNASPASCAVSATANAPWIQIASTAANSVQYTVTANQSTQTRSGTITVAGQTFTISQGAMLCLVSAVNVPDRFGPAGGIGTVTIQVSPSDCTWVATSFTSWITITSPNTGTGTGTLQFRVDPYTAAATRSGQIELDTVQPRLVTGPYFPTIPVRQDGQGCVYSVSPSSVTIPASGTNVFVTTSAPSNCSPAIVTPNSWLTLTAISDIRLAIAATPNTTRQARTGTVLYGDQTITVTQPGATCTFTVTPSAITAPPSGFSGSLSVTAAPSDCAWTVTSSDQSIVTITSGASGTGNGTATYTIAPNLTASSRTATLTIGGQPVTILQTAATTPGSVLTTSAAVSLYDAYSAYSVDLGNTTPQTRTISLNTVGTAPYTSSVANTSAGGPVFVTVSPASGSAPASLVLSANSAGLAPGGTYHNLITFASAGASTTYTVALTVQDAGSSVAKIGIYRNSSGLVLLDTNGDGTCCTGDAAGTIGPGGDIPLAGDWNGSGTRKAGVYRPSSGQFLLDSNNNGNFELGTDLLVAFAPQPGDVPVVGDWTGSGVDRAGIFRALTGTFYLDVAGDGSFSGRAYLGQSGDIPLIGKWNGPGTPSRVGIYRPASVNGQPGNFFLLDTSGDGLYTSADAPLFFLGQPGDVPIIGDWNGNGKSKVGIFRPSTGLFILDQNGNFSFDGPGADSVLYFAPYLTGLTNSTTIQPGDLPITGDWPSTYAGTNTVNVSGRTRTGIYRPSTGTFFLDVSADGTYQGRAFLGQTGDLPVGQPVIVGGAVIGVSYLGSF